MGHMMDLKVQSVNKRLEAFELRVLERLAPITDISSLRTKLDNFWADIEAILAPPMEVLEFTPIALVDDTVLDALYSKDTSQFVSTHARGKGHHSSHSSDATEDARANK
uniref:Integrase core domain containing protein n=1 Tax=Solanum tuberosum TaxID=4113 RepID=M1DTY2_SOLTU